MTASSKWQIYLVLLLYKKIPEQQHCWYVKRVEDFSVGNLEAYFQRRSRDSSLTARQYRQLVDALQLLFVDLSASYLAKTRIGVNGTRPSCN